MIKEQKIPLTKMLFIGKEKIVYDEVKNKCFLCKAIRYHSWVRETPLPSYATAHSDLIFELPRFVLELNKLEENSGKHLKALSVF